MFICYKITNLINNKIYIGRTGVSLKRRLNQHFSKARNNSYFRLHSAIRKYGESNFIIELLFESKDVIVIVEKEKEFISLYNSTNYSNGYNMTFGGLGEYRDENSYKKQSLKLKGRVEDSEWRSKISNSLKEGYRSGKIVHPLKNKKMSESQKSKMRGKKKTITEKYTNARKKRGFKVIEKNSNLTFYTIGEAARFFKVHDSCISRSLKERNGIYKNFNFSFI